MSEEIKEKVVVLDNECSMVLRNRRVELVFVSQEASTGEKNGLRKLFKRDLYYSTIQEALKAYIRKRKGIIEYRGNVVDAENILQSMQVLKDRVEKDFKVVKCTK